jgi:hypothetical protein
MVQSVLGTDLGFWALSDTTAECRLDDHEIPGPQGPRFRRRKKRWAGSTWTPPSMSAEKPDGLWCKVCRQHHGYMSMEIDYEKGSDSKWKILWMCPKTGNVLS